jgi:hypothetical protein
LGFSGAVISFFGSDPHPITKVIQHVQSAQHPMTWRKDLKGIELRFGRHVADDSIVLLPSDELRLSSAAIY